MPCFTSPAYERWSTSSFRRDQYMIVLYLDWRTLKDRCSVIRTDRPQDVNDLSNRTPSLKVFGNWDSVYKSNSETSDSLHPLSMARLCPHSKSLWESPHCACMWLGWEPFCDGIPSHHGVGSCYCCLEDGHYEFVQKDSRILVRRGMVLFDSLQPTI